MTEGYVAYFRTMVSRTVYSGSNVLIFCIHIRDPWLNLFTEKAVLAVFYFDALSEDKID